MPIGEKRGTPTCRPKGFAVTVNRWAAVSCMILLTAVAVLFTPPRALSQDFQSLPRLDDGRETRVDEERLTQKIKAEIMRDLKEGNWLAEQIELGIERYIQKVKAAQEAAVAEQARQANEKARQVRRVIPARDHIRGNPDAELSLIEYSDFECAFCKRFHETAQEIVETHGGKVNWVYRHFPLGIHNPGAQKEAEAAECVYEVGGGAAFWLYADAIFSRTTSNGQGFPQDKLVPLAKELGLDEQVFQNCLDSGLETARVKEDIVEGERIGVSGTPGNILLHNKIGNVRILIGAIPVTDLKTAIAKLLEESSQVNAHAPRD